MATNKTIQDGLFSMTLYIWIVMPLSVILVKGNNIIPFINMATSCFDVKHSSSSAVVCLWKKKDIGDVNQWYDRCVWYVYWENDGFERMKKSFMMKSCQLIDSSLIFCDANTQVDVLTLWPHTGEDYLPSHHKVRLDEIYHSRVGLVWEGEFTFIMFLFMESYKRQYQ